MNGYTTDSLRKMRQKIVAGMSPLQIDYLRALYEDDMECGHRGMSSTAVVEALQRRGLANVYRREEGLHRHVYPAWTAYITLQGQQIVKFLEEERRS